MVAVEQPSDERNYQVESHYEDSDAAESRDALEEHVEN